MKKSLSPVVAVALCAAVVFCLGPAVHADGDGPPPKPGKPERSKTRVRSDMRRGDFKGDFKKIAELMRMMMAHGKKPGARPMGMFPSRASSPSCCPMDDKKAAFAMRRLHEDIEDIKRSLRRIEERERAERHHDAEKREHAERHHGPERFRHHMPPIFMMFLPMMFVCAIMHILLAVWAYVDVKKRDASGFWIAIVLLSGFPGAILYALVRIGDSVSKNSSKK
jgi:hypothetical protein